MTAAVIVDMVLGNYPGSPSGFDQTDSLDSPGIIGQSEVTNTTASELLRHGAGKQRITRN